MFKPVTLTLKDLPRDLLVLPNEFVDQLTKQHQLLAGYIRLTHEYQSHNEEITKTLNEQILKLNEIIAIFDKYQNTSDEINELIPKIHDTFNQFQNLELIQYQLLSTNFNHDLLKTKFQKLIAQSDLQTKQIIHESTGKLGNLTDNYDQFNEFMRLFKQNRKIYHLRQEKLNRWNEERVTGLL